jgi:PIN domain nuclease of toxin-antitoxin system
MRYLLDTQSLLWLVIDDPRLTPQVRFTFLDNQNETFLSIASLWEMAIKISLDKLFIEGSLESFTEKHILANDIQFLPVEPSHICRLEKLPFHHRDPFDRIIIAQAIEENLSIIGSDQVFDKYRIKRIW